MSVVHKQNEHRLGHQKQSRGRTNRRADRTSLGRRPLFETLERRELLAVLSGINPSFEQVTEVSPGDIRVVGWSHGGPVVDNKVLALRDNQFYTHEGTGDGIRGESPFWFGAITIQREDHSGAWGIMSSDWFSATAGDKISGRYFVMAGSNPEGAGVEAKIRLKSTSNQEFYADILEDNINDPDFYPNTSSQAKAYVTGFENGAGRWETFEITVPYTASFKVEAIVRKTEAWRNYRATIGLDNITAENNNAPVVSLSGDSGTHPDNHNHFLNWSASDPDGSTAYQNLTSVSAVLTRNGGVIGTSSSFSGSFTITPSMGLGTYRLTVTATDASGLTDSDFRQVIISDDDTTAPTINFTNAINQFDASDNVVGWSISDASGISSRSVELRRVSNNQLLYSNVTHNSGSINLNGVGLGTFRLEVTATDADNDRSGDSRSAFDSVEFTISDEDTIGPTIDFLDTDVDQLDSADNIVRWAISDPSGISTRTVSVRRLSDNIVIMSSVGTGGIGLFDLNGQAPNTYRIEATATDNDNDRADDKSTATLFSRWFTISDDDLTKPTIELGGSEGSETDAQDQHFTWSISDDGSGIAFRQITVTRNGARIPGPVPSDSGSFDFNSHGPGEYTISVFAHDADSDWGPLDRSVEHATRTVVVTDDDDAGPFIAVADGSLSDGGDNYFSWNISDFSNVFESLVVIAKDGVGPIHTDTSAAGYFDLNPYGAGLYTITVDATDDDFDWSGDRASSSHQRLIIITDDDTLAPTIDIMSGSTSDGDNNYIAWNVTDPSGVYDADVIIRKGLTELYSDTYAPSGSFDLNPHGVGDFTIEITATDDDNDANGDRLTAMSTQLTTIGDDDTEAPVITLGGSSGSESHGLTQEFTWNIADASGLSSALIEVRKNGSPIFSTDSPTGTFNFDGEGLGTFDLLVSVDDADEDWLGDILSANASRSVVVTNVEPIAKNDEDTTDEDSAKTIAVLANDTDADPNEELSVASVDTTGTLGMVTVNPDNTITYDPQDAFQHLTDGQQATDKFSYTVDDGYGGTRTAVVLITIGGLNDAAAISGTASGSTDEDSTTDVTGVLAVSDVDDGEAVFTPQSGVAGSYGTFGIDAAGNWTYTLNNSSVQDLNAGDSVSDSFTVTSVDGTASEVVLITIGGLNDAAAISGTASGSTDEDSTTDVTGVLAVSDVDDGEAVFTPQSGVAGSYGTFGIDAAGNWTYTLNNSSVQDLNAGDSVTDSFTVRSVDGTASEVVLITIGGLNDSPILTVPLNLSVPENASNGTVIGVVSAADVDQNDSLTYSIVPGSGPTVFAIDSATGAISVADSTFLDYEMPPILTLEVRVEDSEGGSDSELVTIDLLNQASIFGVVFVDVNLNGMYDADEPGIDGVVVELRNASGDPVVDAHGAAITALTSDGGFYLFEDLDPGDYQLHELQPSGVTDGAEMLGSLGGSVVANDVMQLSLVREDAYDYVFAELGQQVSAGDTANNGFWQNKNGQSLIAEGGTQLAQWLTATFGNVFGNSLADADGQDIADFYRDQLFMQKGKKSAGPAKVDANFMAVALATYFTNRTLAGDVAVAYGFNVTDTGIGTKIVNVGTSGAAFGVADGTNRTILQLLLATNDLTDLPDGRSGFAEIYDQNGDGFIDSFEAELRTMAHTVFTAINGAGLL